MGILRLRPRVWCGECPSIISFRPRCLRQRRPHTQGPTHDAPRRTAKQITLPAPRRVSVSATSLAASRFAAVGVPRIPCGSSLVTSRDFSSPHLRRAADSTTQASGRALPQRTVSQAAGSTLPALVLRPAVALRPHVAPFVVAQLACCSRPVPRRRWPGQLRPPRRAMARIGKTGWRPTMR